MRQTEATLTAEIRELLNKVGIYHWKQFQAMRGTGRSKKGIPDLIGCRPGGKFLAIEVKTEKGVVSVEQQKFIDDINRMGGQAFVARSLNDVILALGLDRYGW